MTDWARYTPPELHDRISHPEFNDLLRSASDFTADVGWARGEYRDEVTGTRCIQALINDCPGTVRPGDNHIVGSVMHVDGFSWTWNDKLGLQEGETTVRKLLWETIIDDAVLHATFGPQWPEIIALIRRAALLTDEKASRMPGENYRVTANARACAAYREWLGAGDEDDWGFSTLPGSQAVHSIQALSSRPMDHPSLGAAREAAVGIATRHLVGTGDYAEKDHRYLMVRWEKLLKAHPYLATPDYETGLVANE